MPRVSISYRRDDSGATAGRIFDRLTLHYGKGSVFMDIDAIPLGEDFRTYIDQALRSTDILLAIIGPRWIGPSEHGHTRIEDETDPVRLEVEAALRNGIHLIPVLVERASMPRATQMPASIKELVFRNAATIDSGIDFHAHMERLIRAMDGYLESRERLRVAEQQVSTATALGVEPPSRPTPESQAPKPPAWEPQPPSPPQPVSPPQAVLPPQPASAPRPETAAHTVATPAAQMPAAVDESSSDESSSVVLVGTKSVARAARLFLTSPVLFVPALLAACATYSLVRSNTSAGFAILGSLLSILSILATECMARRAWLEGKARLKDVFEGGEALQLGLVALFFLALTIGLGLLQFLSAEPSLRDRNVGWVIVTLGIALAGFIASLAGMQAFAGVIVGGAPALQAVRDSLPRLARRPLVGVGMIIAILAGTALGAMAVAWLRPPLAPAIFVAQLAYQATYAFCALLIVGQHLAERNGPRQRMVIRA